MRQTDYDNLEEESNISLDEWIQYVKSDTELELTSGYQLNLPVLLEPEEIESPTDQSPGYCEWMGHPRSDADTIPWFDFELGNIITEYPDKHTIGKMIKIASVLNAKVRGDDGEYYDDTFFTNGGQFQNNSSPCWCSKKTQRRCCVLCAGTCSWQETNSTTVHY